MSNSDLVVMTTATAKPGKEQDVLQALRDVADAARRRAGCVDYRIVRSTEDPASTINVERWSSAEARDEFLASPDVQRFSAAVSDAFAGAPRPVRYEAID